MNKLISESCEVYIGQNAGDEIYKRIKAAKKSVTILSPYLSPGYVSMLVDIHNEGVRVLLLTNSDMVNNEDKKKKIYRSIIVQHRHLNERAKKVRNYGFYSSFLFLLIAASIGIFGYKTSQKDLLWFLATIPIFLMLLLMFRKKRIYTYSYETVFDFRVFISPYEYKHNDTQSFIHSKIYIIDGEVAFVGSVNLTTKGFRSNYECCVKIEDPKAIADISSEIDHLIQSDTSCFLDLFEIGTKVFPQPPN